MADQLIQIANERIQQLIALKAKLPKGKQPTGRLRVITNHDRSQYYLVDKGSNSNGKYLPRKERRRAAAIAQRDYNAAVAGIIGRQITALNNLTENYHPEEIDTAFTGLHPGRRPLVTPVREPDEDFIARWRHLPYTGKPFEINAPEHYTASGVRVRSKSEIIIADALDRADIPYRYEYPTSVKGWGTLYPDFTCLDTRTREEIIWEHFGLMHDREYAEQTVQKIARYAASGYTLGKNFIATFEANTSPLSIKQVQGYINTLFKSRSE